MQDKRERYQLQDTAPAHLLVETGEEDRFGSSTPCEVAGNRR